MKELQYSKTLYAIRFIYESYGHSYEYLDHQLFESAEIATDHALERWDKLKSFGDSLQRFYPVCFFAYFQQQ